MWTRIRAYQSGFFCAQRDPAKPRNDAYHAEMRLWRGGSELGTLDAFNEGHADALAGKPCKY